VVVPIGSNQSRTSMRSPSPGSGRYVRRLSLAVLLAVSLVILASTLYSWSVVSPVKRSLAGGGGSVYSVAFSPDGRVLATGNDDGSVRLWDAINANQLSPLIGHTSAVYGVAFSHDGSALASASLDGTARVWDVRDARIVASAQFPTNLHCIAFSPDDSTIALGAFDGLLRLWAWKEKGDQAATSFRVDNSWIYSLAFLPDGRRLATASGAGPVKVFELGTNVDVEAYDLPFEVDAVPAVAVSPLGDALVAGSGTARASGEVTVWLTGVRFKPKVVARTSSFVSAVSFSPDGRLLACGDLDGRLRVYSYPSMQLLGGARIHRECISSIASSPDGTSVATGSSDGYAKIIDLKVLLGPSAFPAVPGTARQTIDSAPKGLSPEFGGRKQGRD
jgi:WD40 repeat protein